MNRARVTFLLVALVYALARPVEGQWIKTYGRDTTDIPCSIRETSDGGLVLSGISQYMTSGATDSVTWVSRLTPGGEVKWWTSLRGGTLDDLYGDFNAVAPLADGGFLLAATYKVPSLTQVYLLTVKLDDQGRIVWQRLHGWPGAGPPDRLFKAAAVQASPDGGILVAGAATTEVNGPWHLWVAKLDSSGNLLWQKVYPAAAPGEAHALGQSAEGAVYVAGVSLAWGVGGYDYWVLKLDPAGRVIWQSACGGPQNDIPRGLTAAPDGGCLVVGESYSFGGGVSGRDTWVVKLDATGRMDWQKLFASPSEDWAEAAISTADGGFLVSGASQRGPNTDAYLLKLTSRGEPDWRKTFGSSSGFYKFSNETAADIVALRGGGYAAVGRTSEMGAFTNDLLVLRVTARGETETCAASRDDPVASSDTEAVLTLTTAVEGRTTAMLNAFVAPSVDAVWIAKPICPSKSIKIRR